MDTTITPPPFTRAATACGCEHIRESDPQVTTCRHGQPYPTADALDVWADRQWDRLRGVTA